VGGNPYLNEKRIQLRLLKIEKGTFLFQEFQKKRDM
jgi:hypothetical protein